MAGFRDSQFTLLLCFFMVQNRWT